MLLLQQQQPTTTGHNDDNNNNRNLQNQDPNQCAATGTEFTCNVPSALSQGSNITQLQNTITCTLNSAIGMLFQESENCRCQTILTDQFASGVPPRACACGVCPRGSQQAVSLDCSMNTDHPFVSGPCTSLNCAGQCNGTGATVLNQPTPAPEGTGADEDTEPEGGSSAVVVMNNLVWGTVIGAVVSYWSVYVL